MAIFIDFVTDPYAAAPVAKMAMLFFYGGLNGQEAGTAPPSLKEYHEETSNL